MPLATSKEILERALAERFAVGAFNANKWKWCRPLVLHGSSGVKHESVAEAIEYGMCKVNVATCLNQAFVRGMREAFEKHPDEVDPRKYLSISRENVKEAVREKIRLFKSNGRIDSSGGSTSPPTQYRSADIGGAEE